MHVDVMLFISELGSILSILRELTIHSMNTVSNAFTIEAHDKH